MRTVETVPVAGARRVSKIIVAEATLEGAGFPVRRPFPNATVEQVDPFLLLDHMGPYEVHRGSAPGAPDHPHRGFETVTYMLQGRFSHRDSTGRSGQLGPGDVQWMTAGDGVIHSELPEASYVEQGGPVEGVQVWVNLPRAHKRMAPRYQEIPSLRLPLVTLPDGAGEVKVIAGEVHGQRAVIETITPILYWHVMLRPGGLLRTAVPLDYNVMAYVLAGGGRFGDDGRPVRAGELALFAGDGREVLCTADATGMSALVLGGRPLREPIVRYGPFVMNSKAEITEAIADYQLGKFGRIQ